jgi:hypothetical protein
MEAQAAPEGKGGDVTIHGSSSSSDGSSSTLRFEHTHCWQLLSPGMVIASDMCTPPPEECVSDGSFMQQVGQATV